MINISEVATELEIYYKNRLEKIVKLNNILNENIENNEELCCDTLVMMLYAQLEGYVTELLLYYIETINQEHLKHNQVKFAICAAAKSCFFEAYEESLKNKQKYQARINLIEKLDSFWQEELVIPANIVDTKNNLKESIFIDLMTKLGFDKAIYHRNGSIIDQFVDYRNAVAHGNNNKHLITYAKYKKFEDLIIEIMQDLKTKIFDSINQKQFLKIEV